MLFPHDLALERELGEALHLLIRGDPQELFLPLGAHLEPVPAALKLIAKCAHKSPSASNTKIAG